VLCLALLLFLPSSIHAQDPLQVLVIFAHPDEGEIYVGGTTALYTQLGHKVKFLSLTNGDAGHYSMEPKALAQRRYREAMSAKAILALSDYEVLDHHDGVLKNTEQIRKTVARAIREWQADVVFTFYPAKGGHNDNMTAGWIVRDASLLLEMDPMPAFIYVRDFHTTSFSYIPDVAIAIDDVWETKLAACGAHESQVVEFNPQLEGVLDEVLASKERQREFLVHNTYPFSKITPDNRLALAKWYGSSRAAGVTYVEVFEIAEYGRQLRESEMRKVFPMLPPSAISGSTE
jgi:LmbE family N-acetylglucosaminyl deacetylase